MTFVRIIDYLIFYFLFSIGTQLLPFCVDTFFYALVLLLTPLFNAPLEALSMKYWGRTLGGMFLGHVPKMCSFREALRRALFLKKTPQGAIVPVSWKRKLLAFLCMLICLGGVLFSESIFMRTSPSLKALKGLASQNWILHAVQSAGFSIELPLAPTYFSQEFEAMGRTLVYHEYKSTVADKFSYIVAYMELPRKWRLARSQTLLNGALDVVLEQEGGTLISKEWVRYKKLAALNFLYKKGEEVVEGRLILGRHTLFKLAITHPEVIEQDLKAHSFLDSFELYRN